MNCFSELTLGNDACVLLLAQNMTSVAPIPICASPPPDGAACIVSGWGTETLLALGLSPDLRKASVLIAPFQECSVEYPYITILKANMQKFDLIQSVFAQGS